MQSIIVEKEVQNQFAVVALSVVSDSLTEMTSEGDFVDLLLVGCTPGWGGGVLPYITYTGMCRPKGS